jgi:hypothetical protein
MSESAERSLCVEFCEIAGKMETETYKFYVKITQFYPQFMFYLW